MSLNIMIVLIKYWYTNGPCILGQSGSRDVWSAPNQHEPANGPEEQAVQRNRYAAG